MNRERYASCDAPAPEEKAVVVDGLKRSIPAHPNMP